MQQQTGEQTLPVFELLSWCTVPAVQLAWNTCVASGNHALHADVLDVYLQPEKLQT
jgi:hypothetical protein